MNNGVIPRDKLVAYFKELYNGKLDDYDSYVWEELPFYCSIIHPAEFTGDLDKAVAEGKLSREDLDFVDEQNQCPIDEVLDELKQDEDFSFINEQDVYSLERWVGGFHNHEFAFESDDDDDDEYDGDDYLADDGLLRSLISGRPDFEIPKNIPVKRESFVGRNDPCPCGSGKKYKKCCLGK